jgi:hypothetical protein
MSFEENPKREPRNSENYCTQRTLIAIYAASRLNRNAKTFKVELIVTTSAGRFGRKPEEVAKNSRYAPLVSRLSKYTTPLAFVRTWGLFRNIRFL